MFNSKFWIYRLLRHSLGASATSSNLEEEIIGRLQKGEINKKSPSKARGSTRRGREYVFNAKILTGIATSLRSSQ